MLPSRKRPAFSLIELLVILAFLAMLLGFALSALQTANEQAARAAKTNNLRQVILAVHSFHDVNKRFPPATGSIAVNTPSFTFSVYLLPYVEQAAFWDLISQGKAPPKDVRFEVYNSDQDPSAKDFIRVQNYAANVRVFSDDGFATAWNKTVKLKKEMACSTSFVAITDGTSNTIALATRYAASGTISEKGQAKTPCGYYDLPLTNDGGAFFGATPMAGKVSATSTSGWQMMPSLAEVNCKAALGMAHGMDKGGILVAVCDASVHLIGPNITSENWNYLLQPNDGNAVRIP